MTDKTIRALYLGTLRPEKSRGYKTEEYTEHLNEFRRLYDELLAALPEEHRGLLEAMIEEYNISESEIIADTFVTGFKIGLSLAAEGLCFGN